MADFLGSLSRLRSLHLTDGDCVTDDVLERLAESCHVLQAVAVTSLHPLPITKRGLACLSRLSALTHLQLQDVGDFEVTEGGWARRHLGGTWSRTWHVSGGVTARTGAVATRVSSTQSLRCPSHPPPPAPFSLVLFLHFS